MPVTVVPTPPFQSEEVLQALREIKSAYGDDASVIEKAKSLFKFGENADVDTTDETLMTHIDAVINETYVNRNLITTFSSGSTDDKGIIKLEYHVFPDDISVSSITRSGTTATVTTATDHNLVVGDFVYIEGANEGDYNGIVEILTAPTSTTFTYEVENSPSSPATGTITMTEQSLSFGVQDVEANGQSQVTLSVPCCRVGRAYRPKQSRAAALVGPGYFYEDDTDTSGKPDTDAGVHLIIPAGVNQTQKASTSISESDYFIVTGIYLDVLEKNTANAVCEVQYREMGGVWRPIGPKISASNTAGDPRPFKPYLIIPKNSDVRMIVSVGTGTKRISGGIEGYLASIIS